MKQHLLNIFCSAVLILSLPGCVQSVEQSNKITSTPTPAISSEQTEFESVHQFDPIEEFSPSGELECLYVENTIEGYANEDGFYRTVPRADGCVNLLYTDFATNQEVYLCNQPNCTHGQEGCTAWFPSSMGSHRPVPVGTSLIMVHGGTRGISEELGENALPHIELMELNGSNRQTVYTFGADCLISPLVEDAMARDDKNLYFTIEKYSEDETTRLLCAFDVESEKLFCLKELTEVDEKIISCDSQKLILSYVTAEYTYESKATDLTRQIEVFDLRSLQITPLVTQNYVDLGACYKGLYYVLDRQGQLKSYNLDTREQINQTALLFSDDFQLDDMSFDGVFGGMLLVHTYLYVPERDESVLSYWGVDLEQGEAIELHQMFAAPWGDDFPSLPIAEHNGELLYISGADEKPLETILPDGQIAQMNYDFYCYAMMPTEAYRNNENAGTPIESSFLLS